MTKIIQRREFLAGAAAVGAAGAFSFPTPSIAKGITEWKMVLTWQKVLPGLGTGAVRLAERISEMSGGKLQIKVFGGGELVPAMGVFDAVAGGTAEMGHTAAYYWMSKNKASAFFCTVPGGLNEQEQNGWLYFGGGKQLWDELYGQFGLVSFPAGNTGCQMGGWFNREIKSLSDLKGLKMRMPGLGGEVFSKLGGSAQVIPPQELFTSMQSGVIDALEWVGPWNDLSLGFHTVSKYYYGPAFHEGGPTLELMLNKKAFDGLSKELQRVIKVAAATENILMTAEYHANNIRAFNTLKNQHKVDVRRYPDDVLKAFFKTSEEVVANVGNSGVIEKKIFDSYYNYRKQSMAMTPFTELSFLSGREEA